MSERLDHGILNIPLSKRGNIDAQIDRYKADQARQAKQDRKARAAQMKADRAHAKRLVSELSDEFIQRIASKSGLTPTQVRKNLNSDAHWTPAKIIRVLDKAA